MFFISTPFIGKDLCKCSDNIGIKGANVLSPISKHLSKTQQCAAASLLSETRNHLLVDS